MNKIVRIFILGGILFLGCEKKFDLSLLPPSTSVVTRSDTTYIQKGSWEGMFSRPNSILYGRDQLFYVADTYNNRIVLLNQAGIILDVLPNIIHPVCLAQDNRLDLLVGAEAISQNSSSIDTIGVIYRIKMVAANHLISVAKIDTVWKEPARPKRRFIGIGVIIEDEFLVLRDGPDITSPVDPDSRVLRFKYIRIDSSNYKDKLITALGEFQPSQSGQTVLITTLNHPTGIATFPDSRDFVLIQTSEGVQYPAVWMTYTVSTDYTGWAPKYDPLLVTGIDFIRPNRFSSAKGVAINQSTKDIVIVDAAQDSIVKFNNRGKFKFESFGAKSPGINLKNPTGITIAENVLYVCDTDNNRIVLFRLSTGK
jgi:hypothetical protein